MLLRYELRGDVGGNASTSSILNRSARADAQNSPKAASFRRIPYWSVCLALLAMPMSAWAQATAVSEESPANDSRPGATLMDMRGVSTKPARPIHVEVDLALVNVTVTDPHDRMVTGLSPTNFRVFENNIEQEVVALSSEDIPISVGIIFDNSGSMANKISLAREAVIEFFRTSNPEDEFFFVSFNERTELTSGFTRNAEDLQSRMVLTTPRGSTALLDAIYLGLSQMRMAQNSRRALLILSDGGDNHSRYSQSDVMRLVREADTQLYAIGIFDPLEYRGRTSEELFGPSLLSEITEMTGGRLLEVENPNNLPDTAAKIGMELRNQYVLGYRPSNKAHDARWRKIKIKLRMPEGLPPLKVYSKTGYYAPSH